MSCDLNVPAKVGRKDGQWTVNGRGRKGTKSVGHEGGATVRKQCRKMKDRGEEKKRLTFDRSDVNYVRG